MLREAVRQVGTVWLGFRPPAVTESLRAALKDSAAGFVPSPGLNANRGSAGGCQGHLWTAVIVEFCHPGSAHHSAVRVCLSVTLSVPETPDVALWTSEDIMAFKYKDNFKQQREKTTFFSILPVTAHLHRSVSWGWPCGGTRAQSEEEGSLEAGSSGFGDVGETPPGGGTADGGEEWCSSACGWACCSGVFSSSWSPAPFLVSPHAAGCAWAEPSAAVGSKPLEGEGWGTVVWKKNKRGDEGRNGRFKTQNGLNPRRIKFNIWMIFLCSLSVWKGKKVIVF